MHELNHISYEKISSNFNKYKLTEADYRLLKKNDWIVTEKIHGANFCIISDGTIVRFAKRKELLAEQDNFFGYQILAEELQNKALAIFQAIQSVCPDTVHIAIYGELFGGEYPHEDVEVNSQVNAIQTGVYYSPNIEFMAFDIAYINNKQERNYLDCDLLIHICQNTNLQYIPVLFRGKYQNAIAYKIEFTTTIPRLFNLPSLDRENFAEGIVIKPANNFFLETAKGKLRPVVKIKIPKFAEDKRFHQAQKWNYHSYKNQQQSSLTSDRLLEIEALNLITLNRWNNLVSKIGKPIKNSKKKRNSILQLYIKDVIEDLEENLDVVFINLEKNSQKKLLALIEKQATILIKDINLKQINQRSNSRMSQGNARKQHPKY